LPEKKSYNGDEKDCTRDYRRRHPPPLCYGAASARLYSFGFLGHFRVADVVGVEIEGVHADAVFHFTVAKIVQARLPLPILLQIFRDMPGEKNVARITAIHDPLRDIDAGARNVRLFVQIRDFVDRTAVNSHANPKVGMTL
jgi:hypothetical protein